MVQRIREIMKYYHLTIIDLSQKLGISRYTIDKYLQGVNPISSKFITKILCVYPDINKDWFLEGKGDMLVTKSADKLSAIIQDAPNNGMCPESLEESFKMLLSYHIDEVKALQTEIEKQQAVIDRLADIIAKKSGL